MIRNLLLQPEILGKTAVIEYEQNLSYGDILAKAQAVQKQLPPNTGQNIAIFLPNSADYIAALWGVLMAGHTAFPLNTQLTAHETAPLLAQADVSTVISSQKFQPLFSTMAGHIPPVIYMEELPPSAAEPAPRPAQVCEDHAMILLSTSGTTGRAKIVQLSEKNVATAVHGFSSYNNYEKFGLHSIKYILGTPFASVYGLLILSTCLLNTFPIIIPQEAVTADVLYREAEKHRVSHYEGGAAVPIMMEQMANRPLAYDISSLKFIGYGGSKIADAVLKRLGAAFPDINIYTGYGSTESAAMISRPYKELPPEKFGSVGVAIPGVTIMVEADGIITDEPGIRGEVVVKGPNVMLGYYHNEEETRHIIKDNCLYTGDIGYLDEDGYLFLCGRKKNVIMVRGYSVYAEEVESSLLGSGLVKDCLVYGETDALGNETLCVNIVPQNPQVITDAIRAYCSQHLAAYKQPQKLFMVEAIKKTATGKSSRT